MANFRRPLLAPLKIPFLRTSTNYPSLCRRFFAAPPAYIPPMPSTLFRRDFSPDASSQPTSSPDMSMKDATPLMGFDNSLHFDSPPSDSDQMIFPLDFDDGTQYGASTSLQWNPYNNFSSSDLTSHPPSFDFNVADAFSRDATFDSGVFYGLGEMQSTLSEFGGGDFSQWLNDPELPALEPSSSPIPIRSPASDIQTPPFVPYLDSHALSLSPSTFAALHPLPRSASPMPAFEDSKAFQGRLFDSVSPQDTSLHTPSWASDLWDVPHYPHAISPPSSTLHTPASEHSFRTKRQCIPSRRESISTGQSSSAPSPYQARAPGLARTYSRRAESVSVSDDRDATIRRKKRLPSPEEARNAERTSESLPAKSLLRPPKLAPSAWQLYFTDWIQRQQASNTRKLNVAQAAKEAGQEYASLSQEEKEPYKRRSQAAKEARERELAAYMRTLTPDDIKRENAFRTAQRKAGKSRKSNIKDPNAPKKPLSAYFMFLQRIRSNPRLVKEVFGDETETTKQSVLAAAKWRSMTDDERKPFLAQAEQEKLDYEAARRLYEEGTPGFGTSINFSILPGSPAETAFRASRTDSFSSESESEGFTTDDAMDHFIRS